MFGFYVNRLCCSGCLRLAAHRTDAIRLKISSELKRDEAKDSCLSVEAHGGGWADAVGYSWPLRCVWMNGQLYCTVDGESSLQEISWPKRNRTDFIRRDVRVRSVPYNVTGMALSNRAPINRYGTQRACQLRLRCIGTLRSRTESQINRHGSALSETQM